jgi:hypothetical protein
LIAQRSSIARPAVPIRATGAAPRQHPRRVLRKAIEKPKVRPSPFHWVAWHENSVQVLCVARGDFKWLRQ